MRDRLAQFWHDKSFHEGLSESLLFAETRDLLGQVVPLIHFAFGVDAEDGSICGVHQLTELSCHGGHSSVVLGRFRYILSNTNDTNDFVVGIAAGGGINKEITSLI